MKKIAVLLSALAGVIVVGGANGAVARPNEAAQTKKVINPLNLRLEKPISEMVHDNNWIGTNLQKRAVKASPTVQNRFNLGAGYFRTGRLSLAKKYYETVAEDGQGVTLIDVDTGRTFDAGLIAADRLLYINAKLNKALPGKGIVAAETAATDASAIVGGNGEQEVDDKQARALDRLARATKP